MWFVIFALRGPCCRWVSGSSPLLCQDGGVGSLSRDPVMVALRIFHITVLFALPVSLPSRKRFGGCRLLSSRCCGAWLLLFVPSPSACLAKHQESFLKVGDVEQQKLLWATKKAFVSPLLVYSTLYVFLISTRQLQLKVVASPAGYNGNKSGRLQWRRGACCSLLSSFRRSQRGIVARKGRRFRL